MNSDYGLEVVSWAVFGCFLGFLGWMWIDSGILQDRYLTKGIVDRGNYVQMIRLLLSVVTGLLFLGAGYIGYQFFSPDFRADHWGMFLLAVFSGYMLWNIFVRWIWGMRKPPKSGKHQ